MVFIIILFSLLVLLKVLFRLYKSKIKGKIGESIVAIKLSKLDKKNYKVYNDLNLSFNGYTTQIDHLILSTYGIFVIETKNYKGWIFGNEKSTYWTQVIYETKNKFYNPILQNWKHINFLKRLSPALKSAKYFPIIVFIGSGELRNIDSTVPVIYLQNLKALVKSKNEEVLTQKELKSLEMFINKFLKSKKEIKKQHIKSFNLLKSSENRTCPYCGSYLKIKEGKYGEFFGCSSYPRCNYTKRIN